MAHLCAAHKCAMAHFPRQGMRFLGVLSFQSSSLGMRLCRKLLLRFFRKNSKRSFCCNHVPMLEHGNEACKREHGNEGCRGADGSSWNSFF